MEAWNDFFIAQVGASAALAGLIFVSVSINLDKILKSPKLPDRGLLALAILVQILIVSSLMLVPGQALTLLGIELVLVGSGVWLLLASYDLRSLRTTDRQYRNVGFFNMSMSQLATLPYIVAGATFLVGSVTGFYWIVAGILFSYAKAVIDAWVLLIEINR